MLPAQYLLQSSSNPLSRGKEIYLVAKLLEFFFAMVSPLPFPSPSQYSDNNP